MYSNAQTLIVVYKDELLLNELRKLVETNDDLDGQFVGTEDGSVTIVAWKEKTWLEQKRAGDISSKVLFIGEIKGTENLSPLINWKFEKFGVKYGWSGKQALIIADPKAVKKKKDYEKFLEALKSEITVEAVKNKKKKIGLNAPTILKGAGFLFAPWIAGAALGGFLIKDAFDDATTVKHQQYIYGIDKLYMNDLETFMKS